jgi:hypothetical protein
VRAEVVSTAADDIGIGVCILVALLYWLVFLRGRPSFRGTSAEAPEGFGAGEVGTLLSMRGGDLTMMVLSWAQLGYVYLQLDRRDRVTVCRRMDMGNERSGFEGRVFQSLFNRRSAVDGTGLHYAKLYRKVARQSPLLPQLFKKKSGNPLVFRVLVCAAGVLSGVKLGLALSAHPVLQVLLAILVCLLCGVFSYFIQSGGKCLPLRDKTPYHLQPVQSPPDQ